jgi:Relaxase/Mobilisation nuclease domain
MFAGGNLHGDSGKLADYLTKAKKEGERVELAEVRGFVFDDIHQALFSAELQAFEKTNCEYPFFHGYMRAATGEHLDKAQWLHCIDEYEKSLGFTGQPRAVSFHIDEQSGEMHPHVAWSRIDTENEKYFAIDPGLYVLKGIEVARELEIELGLRRLGERDPENKISAPTRDELEEARRLKTDLKEIRETIRECWEHSDNGRSFSAALEQEGLILAQGDRRDFVVIDQEGGHHALNKGITGATAAKTRERRADLDRAQLPTVEQAQAQQLEREIAGLEQEQTVEQSATRSQPEPTAEKPLGPIVGEIHLAYSLTESARGFAVCPRTWQGRGFASPVVSLSNRKG